MAVGSREGVGGGKNCFNRPVVRLKQLGWGKQIGNIKKGADIVSKTITLHLHHTFWYIKLLFDPLPSLYGLPREIAKLVHV